MAEDDDKTKRAWQAYLDETKDLDGAKYIEVESWAWARLRGSLGMLRPKRAERVKTVA